MSALLPAWPPQADDQRLFVDHQFARRNIDCVGSDYTATGPTADDFFLLVKGLLKIYEPVAMATLLDGAAVYSERGSFASDQHE